MIGMRLARLALGAAVIAGCVPFATASHARCTQPAARICSTAAFACGTLEDAGVVPPNTCPQY